MFGSSSAAVIPTTFPITPSARLTLATIRTDSRLQRGFARYIRGERGTTLLMTLMELYEETRDQGGFYLLELSELYHYASEASRYGSLYHLGQPRNISNINHAGLRIDCFQGLFYQLEWTPDRGYFCRWLENPEHALDLLD